MALSKKELLQGGVPNQQALVKRMQAQKVLPARKMEIPGGNRMLETLDQDTMEKAVYNWLRGCRAFSQVTVSFAKDPDIYQCRVQKMADFDAPADKTEIWERHPEGRLHLAKAIAEVINNNQAVKIVAKKDGIWLHQDVNGQFSPVTTATQEDVTAQLQLVKEVKEEMIEAGEDPDTLEYLAIGVGDEMPSVDWAPYIEFVPKRKKEYGL